MRRRKKLWLLSVALLFYALHFIGVYQPLDEAFAELSSCPACYSQVMCQALLEHEYSSQKIVLSGFSNWKLMKLINYKNVYYGMNGENPVVLKKLAHDSELRDFDNTLCNLVYKRKDCVVSQAMKSLVTKNNHNIAQIIRRYPLLFGSSDGVRCSHNQTIQHLFEKYTKLDSGFYQQHHFLTMLAVNIEPLILNAYQHGWFPALHGMCGRVIVEDYVGPTLSQFGHAPWLERAEYALQLLEMAQDFSDGEFHLYLTDVSLDNFAVDSKGKVKVIDAENIIIVDPSINGLDPTEHVNDGFGCRDCLSFSYEDLCGHTSSDHNFFAVCKGILSSTAFSRDLPVGLLHSPPSWLVAEHPSFLLQVEDCAGHRDLSPDYHPKRREAAAILHSELQSIIQKTMNHR